VPVISDVHETLQVPMAMQALDALQIPAFLCRQTDLLVAAGETGLPVNVKKGQFLAPEDMEHVIGKVTSTGNE
jgi:2-dehydro-3-deoxyphosphooctonate aldolase (KDO 8-P synthase)